MRCKATSTAKPMLDFLHNENRLAMSTADKQHNYFKEEYSEDESDIACGSERQRNKVKE